MASWQDIGLSDMTFVADVDLTLAQYYFVSPASTAGNVGVATGASNPAPLGVLQNSPSLGQEARVRPFGPPKLFIKTGSGSALGFGRYIIVNASGQGIPLATDGGSATMGRNVGAGVAVSSSQVIDAFVWPWATCAISAS